MINSLERNINVSLLQKKSYLVHFVLRKSNAKGMASAQNRFKDPNFASTILSSPTMNTSLENEYTTPVPTSTTSPTSPNSVHGIFFDRLEYVEGLYKHTIPLVIEDESIKSEIKWICKSFIKPGSEHELNIPGHMVKKVLQSVQEDNVSDDIFDGCVYEVLDMLYQNTFKSFLQHFSTDSPV